MYTTTVATASSGRSRTKVRRFEPKTHIESICKRCDRKRSAITLLLSFSIHFYTSAAKETGLQTITNKQAFAVAYSNRFTSFPSIIFLLSSKQTFYVIIVNNISSRLTDAVSPPFSHPSTLSSFKDTFLHAFG